MATLGAAEAAQPTEADLMAPVEQAGGQPDAACSGGDAGQSNPAAAAEQLPPELQLEHEHHEQRKQQHEAPPMASSSAGESPGSPQQHDDQQQEQPHPLWQGPPSFSPELSLQQGGDAPPLEHAAAAPSNPP